METSVAWITLIGVIVTGGMSAYATVAAARHGRQITPSNGRPLAHIVESIAASVQLQSTALTRLDQALGSHIADPNAHTKGQSP